MSKKINIEIDLSDAIKIELDSITDDNNAILYVEYHSSAKNYKISLKELARLTELASFKWAMDRLD